MKPLHVVWHPAYALRSHLSLLRVFGMLHPAPFLKYEKVHDILDGAKGIRFIKPRPVMRKELLRAHSASYIDEVEDLATRGMIGSGFKIRFSEACIDADCWPFNDVILDFFKASVGGTILAAKVACNTQSTVVNLSGGFHHATRGRGRGFCILNDVAVAIKTLKKRTMIIDLDVHHGDGNATFFKNDDSVFTFSMHQRSGYPMHKPASSFDIPLRDGTDDDQYLDALAMWLPGCLHMFQPELVFYIAGADPLETDKLGGMSLSLDGLASRDQFVLERMAEWQLPTVVVMGGGYSDLETTAEAHLNTVLAARKFTL